MQSYEDGECSLDVDKVIGFGQEKERCDIFICDQDLVRGIIYYYEFRLLFNIYMGINNNIICY